MKPGSSRRRYSVRVQLARHPTGQSVRDRKAEAWMFFSALLLGACTNEPEGPNFHEDVAPILDAHCMQCHDTDGIGPMVFDSYESTLPWAEAIAATTANRTMPPKQVVGDGSCGDFRDPWWVSDADIQTLTDWADAGAPEGPEGTARSSAPLPTLDPTLVASTPEFAPEPLGSETAEFDEYRCFLLDMDFDEPTFLTGYDVIPGNPALVHHLIGVIVDPEDQSSDPTMTNGERMAALDAESPDREGWPCITGAGSGIRYDSDPVAWAPGQGAVNYPEGHGVQIPAGSKFVAQIHYNLIDPASEGQTDSSTVKLRTEPSVDRVMFPLYLDFLLAFDDVLPPGETSYLYDNSLRLSDLGVPFGVDLIGVMPHMHGYGRELILEVERAGGENECLVDVDDWNFDWQFAYFYDNARRSGHQRPSSN